METPELPLILLAGRDRRGATLPEGRPDLHLLRGYKAVELEIAGRPLLVRLLERLRECGGFGPVFVAGPARVYEPLQESLAGEFRLIDTDSDFGGNLRAALEEVRSLGFAGHVAVMTSDVLPDPGEMRQVLDDLERHQPCDFLMVECRADDAARLGASDWKRRYLIRPRGESAAVPTLPGHFVVADLGAVRLDLLYGIFELAYRTRNRPTSYRRAVIVRSVLAKLFAEDLKRLARLGRPGVTWELVWNGLVLIKKLVTTGIDQDEMEDRVRRMWIRWRHRRRHPERRGRVMIHDGLSLARDVDTEEEAREVQRLWESVASRAV